MNKATHRQIPTQELQRMPADVRREICDQFVIATNYNNREEAEELFKDRAPFDYTKYSPYLRHEQAIRRVPLGTPEFPPAPPIWDVFRNRRSRRAFIDEPMSLNEFNVLLWCTQGITGEINIRGRDVSYKLRTAPSSGGLYPIETYLFVNSVTGLEPGLYHLDVEDWALEALRLGDVTEEAYEGLMEQTHTRTAAVNVVWTAVLPRCRNKYFERAYRYIWWDVGHISENLHLAASALGLGSCPMGAWYDGKINQSLGLDGVEHLSVLTASVGHVQGEDWLADRR
jgi:SagB-type dehydrogenase family enzyme